MCVTGRSVWSVEGDVSVLMNSNSEVVAAKLPLHILYQQLIATCPDTLMGLCISSCSLRSLTACFPCRRTAPCRTSWCPSGGGSSAIPSTATLTWCPPRCATSPPSCSQVSCRQPASRLACTVEGVERLPGVAILLYHHSV